MPSLNIPNSFTNGTVANATEVNANFASIKSFVETQTVQVDGSVKAGTNSLSTALMNILCPIGSISPFAGSSAPTGWLMCDGSSTAGYPSLVAIVGATTPDLRGRTLIGAGTGTGLTARVLAATGGAETHTLTIAEMPSHVHNTNRDLNSVNAQPAVGGDVIGVKSGNWNTLATGGGGAHNNMQPFHVVNYIIKHD